MRVYAAEPETAAPLATSLARGEASYFEDWKPSFVDGAGGKSVLPTMWPLLKELVDGSIVVTLDEIAAAMRKTAERVHVVAEGAGGTAIAAALSGRAGTGKIVAVVSGGNIDLSRFAELGTAASSNMSEERFSKAAPLPDSTPSPARARARSVVELGRRGAAVVPPARLRLWRATAHNPVQMLQQITPERLAAAADDPEFLKAYDEAIFGLDEARSVGASVVARQRSRC